jgi:hypothetical protein
MMMNHDWLVVWNMFFHISGIIIPTDELLFFKGVQTTNQMSYNGRLWDVPSRTFT